LFGGWAVHFYVGAITRDHEDIDFAGWQRDSQTIKTVLEHAGWQHMPDLDEAADRFWRKSVLVEFTIVVTAKVGSIVILIHDQPLVWSTDPFGDQRRTLLGVSCRCIPLDLLTAGKATPREAADDTAKDRADFEVLSRLKA